MKASLETIFKKEELQNAVKAEVQLLSTTYFENKGNTFKIKALPLEAQFSPIYAFAAVDVDQDGDNDVVMGGNESNVRVRLGRSDANRGQVLINDGVGNFSYLPQGRSGLKVVGDVRSILTTRGKIIFGINNERIRSYRLTERQSKVNEIIQ